MAISIADNTFSTIPVFSENQVLRARDLNNLVNAVFDQLRQNRIFNIGLGIVEGFSVDWKESTKSLVVTRGFGVSSDGYAFDLKECAFTHFRSAEGLKDAYKKLVSECIEYDTLLASIAEAGYELGAPTATEAIQQGWLPLVPESDEGEKVAEGTYCLVYLYREPQLNGASCFNDCEVKGNDQVGNYHAILLKVVPTDDPVDPDVSKHDKLPKVPQLSAFGLVGDEVKLCRIQRWEDLYESYREACLNIGGDLATAYGCVSFLLDPPDNEDFGITDTDIYKEMIKFFDKLTSEVYPEDPGENCTDIQYLYAYFRELIVAYSEVYQLLEGQILSLESSTGGANLSVSCLFSGHLKLRTLLFTADSDGSPVIPTVNELEDTCRTGRVLPENGEERRSLRTDVEQLFARMQALVTESNLLLSTQNKKKLSYLRITPDALRFPFFRGRALPFYYESTILNAWRMGEQPNVRAYHYQPLLQTLDDGEEKRHPLFFAEEDWDFYRVEGHQGKPLKSLEFDQRSNRFVDRGVKAQIEELRDCLNLSFDVVAVCLDEIEKGDRAPEINGTSWGNWYKNTRNDLRSTLLPFVQQDKENGDGANDVDDAQLFEACLYVVDFLRTRERLAQIDDWSELSSTDFCQPLPTELTSPVLEEFVASYELLVDALEAYRQEQRANGGNNIQSASSEVPYLDRRLGQCIFEAAVAERLYRESIWRQTYFAGFAQAHPGMVHRGGVSKGGTLVLVHKNEFNDDVILQEIKELRALNSKDPTIRARLLMLTQQLQSGELGGQVSVVVADFFLPYLCCGSGPVNLTIVPPPPLPPLEITVSEIGCADLETDKKGVPIFLTLSGEGGTLEFTANNKQLEFAGPSPITSEEYFLQQLTAADFADGPLTITAKHTIGDRSVETNFTVFRRPEIGLNPLSYKETVTIDGTTTIIFDLNLQSSSAEDEVKVTLDGVVENLFNPDTGMVTVPFESVVLNAAVTILVENKACRDRSEIRLCDPLTRAVTLKWGCNFVEGDCKLNCKKENILITDSETIILNRSELASGVVSLCPAVPGGSFSVMSTVPGGEDVDFVPSGLILEKPPTGEGDEWQYHLVLDFEAFKQVVDPDGGLLKCYGFDEQFPFQLDKDKFPTGFLTSITLRYSMGECGGQSITIEIPIAEGPETPQDGGVIIVSDTDPAVRSRSIAIPKPNFAAVLNARRNGRLSALRVLRGTDGDPAGEEAFKRTLLYLSDTGANVNPKKGLTDALEALTQLKTKEPKLEVSVRKIGELLATSFLDKLALVGKKEELTKSRKGMLVTLKEGLEKIEVNRNTVFSEWSVSELYDGLDKTRLTNIGKQLRD